MDITIVGPGRAGMSLALAATAAGHRVVAVVARRRDAAEAAAAQLGSPALEIGDELPPSDLVVIAVRDDAIGPVAAALAGSVGRCRAAVHVSGLVPVAALAVLAGAELVTGSFHPLQTLPTPEAGASRLAGAWIGITADVPALHERLVALAHSLGAHPFTLADSAKATYHAGAAAAANFPLAALTMASDLFGRAGVPWEAARPLVDAVVSNAFELGPRAALTGPVARGDVITVAGQFDAVQRDAPEWLATYAAFVRELARLTGRGDAFEDLISGRRVRRDGE
jgi:predicted short-subunit dehydrogenase-like oxidoreductase (DUF2520 family)